MIVDFVKIRRLLDRIAYLHLLRLRRNHHSIVRLIKNHTLHEGSTATYETVENEKRDLELKMHTAKFEITFEQTQKLRVKDVLEIYEKIGLDLLEQQEKMLVEMMSNSCEEIGNTVDASQLSLSDAFLEVLRTIHIDFDEIRDRPNMPTVVLNPTTHQKLQKHLSEMTPEELEEHEKERQKILDAKFQEYLLREGNRKLVD